MFRFALVDFGLAQSYEKKENIFDYESTAIKKLSTAKGECTPIKHNLIALSKKSSKTTSTPNSTNASSRLVLDKNPTKLASIINQNNVEASSMPHAPAKDNKTGK